jgi:dipeptidyl aminopeptidase/acylaminoacyl peptidase
MTRPHFSELVLLLVLTCSAFATDKPKITFDEFFNSVDFTAVQISPDGNSVVIATERADWDREIYRTDLWLYRDDGHGASLTQLTQSGHDSVPRWSPDGRWIAFLSEREPPSGKGREGDDDGKDAGDKAVAQIYLISPNGGEAFPITSGDEEVHTFNWSPDSKTIYFATRTPWNKDQKDAYKKLWKDTIQNRGAERGDMIFGLDLKEA